MKLPHSMKFWFICLLVVSLLFRPLTYCSSAKLSFLKRYQKSYLKIIKVPLTTLSVRNARKKCIVHMHYHHHLWGRKNFSQSWIGHKWFRVRTFKLQTIEISGMTLNWVKELMKFQLHFHFLRSELFSLLPIFHQRFDHKTVARIKEF